MSKLVRISGPPKFKAEGDGVRVILKSDDKTFHFHFSVHDVMRGVEEGGHFLRELFEAQERKVRRLGRGGSH